MSTAKIPDFGQKVVVKILDILSLEKRLSFGRDIKATDDVYERVDFPEQVGNPNKR